MTSARHSRYALIAASSIALFQVATPAIATTWTDWTSASSTAASGTAGTVTVSFSSTSGLWSWQTAGGTDYFNPWPAGAARPDNTDILELGEAGTRTITFSQAVTGVQLALVSWNVPGTVTFDHAFSNAVIGCGYWGCGSITATGGNTGFDASGEVHGTLSFAGPITSLTITDGSEYWHGLSVGYDALAPAVPEPSAYALMALGIAGVAAAVRRRRT